MEDLNQNALPFIVRKMLDFEESSTFSLVVDVYSLSATEYTLRGYTKAGAFRFPIQTVASSTFQTFSIPVSDVPVAVSLASEDPTDGLAHGHAKISLAVNGDKIVSLAQGTVGFYSDISWPVQNLATPDQQNGAVVEVFSLDPAAGETVLIDVPPQERWEILGVRTALTADANAGNRIVSIIFSTFGEYTITRANGTNQTANQTIKYNFVPDGTTGVITSASEHEIKIPQGIILTPGSFIAIEHTNAGAGDNYSTTIVLVRRIFSNYNEIDLIA